MKIRYGDEEIAANAGERLLDAILRSGADHRHVCGGHGFCTSCRIEVVEGTMHLSAVSSLERQRLGSLAGHIRLACQTHVLGPVSIRVTQPLSSRFSLDDEN